MTDRRWQVAVLTTEGPAILTHMQCETTRLHRSAALVDGGYDHAISPADYDAFVNAPTGIVEDRFHATDFRVRLTRQIHSGRSWQLPMFLAHALFHEGRLFLGQEDAAEAPAGLLLATGLVRSPGLELGEVGEVLRKLERAEELIAQAAGEGRQVRLILPPGNRDDLTAVMARRLAALGGLTLTPADAFEAARALDLSLPDGQAAAAEAQTWSGNPYPGLQAFEAGQSSIFFGRDRAREETLERLRRNALQGLALLVVHGVSGAGKSSLVRAGLAPELLDAGFDGAPETLSEPRLGSDAAALATEIAAVSGRADAEAPALIVLDQFEQVLAANGSGEGALDPGGAVQDGLAMLDAAMVAALSGGRVWFVITLRSDQLPRLDLLASLSRLINADVFYRLAAPTLSELTEMIRGPARLAGLEFEADPVRGDLAAHIAQEAMGAPDALPLLQVCLRGLVGQVAPGGTLDFASYDRIGGFAGAAARWARQASLRLTEDLGLEEAALDRALTSLIRIEPESGAALARPVALAELEPSQAAIMERLVDDRLLIADQRGERRHVTLSHEALIRRWDRLRQLAEVHRADIQLRDWLVAMAGDWSEAGEKPARLLRDLDRLEEGERLAHSGSVDLPDRPRAYLAASRAEQDATQARDRARVDEQRALRESARKSRRLLGIVGRVVAAGVVIAAIGTGIGLVRWFALVEEANVIRSEARQTLQQGRISEARALSLQGRQTEALRAALAAWPDESDPADMQVPEDLPGVMAAAIRGQREVARIAGDWAQVAASAESGEVFLLDDKNVLSVYATADWTLSERVTSLDPRMAELALDAGSGRVSDFAVSPDGRFVALIALPVSERLYGEAAKAETAAPMMTAVFLLDRSDDGLYRWFFDWPMEDDGAERTEFDEVLFDPDGTHFSFSYRGGVAIFSLGEGGIVEPDPETDPFLGIEDLGGYPLSMGFEKGGDGIAFVLSETGWLSTAGDNNISVVRLTAEDREPSEPLRLPGDWPMESVFDEGLTRVLAVEDVEDVEAGDMQYAFRSVSLFRLGVPQVPSDKPLGELLFSHFGRNAEERVTLPRGFDASLKSGKLILQGENTIVLRDPADPAEDLVRLEGPNVEWAHVFDTHSVQFHGERGTPTRYASVMRLQGPQFFAPTGEAPMRLDWTGPDTVAWATPRAFGIASEGQTSRHRFDPVVRSDYTYGLGGDFLSGTGLFVYRDEQAKTGMVDAASGRRVDVASDLPPDWDVSAFSLGPESFALRSGDNGEDLQVYALAGEGAPVAEASYPMSNFLSYWAPGHGVGVPPFLTLEERDRAQEFPFSTLLLRPDGAPIGKPLLRRFGQGSGHDPMTNLRGRHQSAFGDRLVDVASGEELWSFGDMVLAFEPASWRVAVSQKGGISVETLPFASAPLPDVACAMLPVVPEPGDPAAVGLDGEADVCPETPRESADMRALSEFWAEVDSRLNGD